MRSRRGVLPSSSVSPFFISYAIVGVLCICQTDSSASNASKTKEKVVGKQCLVGEMVENRRENNIIHRSNRTGVFSLLSIGRLGFHVFIAHTTAVAISTTDIFISKCHLFRFRCYLDRHFPSMSVKPKRISAYPVLVFWFANFICSLEPSRA